MLSLIAGHGLALHLLHIVTRAALAMLGSFAKRPPPEEAPPVEGGHGCKRTCSSLRALAALQKKSRTLAACVELRGTRTGAQLAGCRPGAG